MCLPGPTASARNSERRGREEWTRKAEMERVGLDEEVEAVAAVQAADELEEAVAAVEEVVMECVLM